MRPRIKAIPVCSVTGMKSVNLQTAKEKRYCVFMAAANNRVMTHQGAAFVNVSGKIMYWVEVLDFLNTLLPEIGFSKAYIYKTEDKAYCRAQMKDTHIDKRHLSILNNHCKDYILDVCEDNFSDGGSPLGSSLDIVIPLQY